MNSLETVYDKVIVGGGIAALVTAYECLRTARENGAPIPRIIVLAKELNAPAKASSNITLGIDGFEDSPDHVGSQQIKTMMLAATQRLQSIVQDENIECRLSMGYQLLASDSRNPMTEKPVTAQESMTRTLAFLASHFGYKSSDFYPLKNPSEHIGFGGFTEVWETQTIGQINTPELLRGLIKAITKMGGEVREGVAYENHTTVSGQTILNTSHGVYKSSAVPLLATGAVHLKSIGLPIEPLYAGALHVKLSSEDQRKLRPGGKPIAFCDTNISGDVFWGGLDSTGVLTIGFGEIAGLKDQAVYDRARDGLNDALRERFHKLLPTLYGKYDNVMSFSFGPQAMTQNKFPIVGRLPNYDVSGGWCTRGIVGSVAAAQAYARMFVLGDDKSLKIWEDLNVTELRNIPSSPERPSISSSPQQFYVLNKPPPI